MPMPETSIDIDGRLIFRQEDIWMPGIAFVIFTIAIAESEEEPSYKDLHAGIPSFYMRHDDASILSFETVHDIIIYNKHPLSDRSYPFIIRT